jgi:hypothetical protein
MDEQKPDGSEVLETTETEVVQEEDTTEDDAPQTDEEKEALRRENEELKKKNSQLYERVKKKDGENKGTGLSAKDLLALKDANITADDLDEVQDYAAFRKVSLAEALQHPTLKTILAEKAEERRTAQATQTRSPRGTAKSTGLDHLKRAEKTGEMPDDADAIRDMLQANIDRRRNK